MNAVSAGQTVEQKQLSLVRILLLTVMLAGVQFAWTVEFAYGTPFLLSLGMPKSLTALVWLAGPLSGLLIQPLVGVWSDRSQSNWGKRRPFIVLSSIIVAISIYSIAYAETIANSFMAENKGITIFIAVFAFYLLDFSVNAVMACCRALIVDVAPSSQQDLANAWAGRMVGFGNVIGYYAGNLDLPAIFGDSDIATENLSNSPVLKDQVRILSLLCISFFIATISLTCLFTPEKKPDPAYIPQKRRFFDPIIKIINHISNLPPKIQSICNIQFVAWLGWFSFLFYATSWIGGLDDRNSVISSKDLDVKKGSFALLLFAIMSLLSGSILPIFTKWISITRIWAYSLFMMGLLMVSTIFVEDVTTATAFTALAGIPWGVALWVPFSLIGEFISLQKPHSYTQIRESEDTLQGTPEVIAPERALLTHDSNIGALEAGVVIGIHNIYIVIPQFVSTLLSSIIFSFVNEEKYVLSLGGCAWLVAGFMAFKFVVNSKDKDDKFEE